MKPVKNKSSKPSKSNTGKPIKGGKPKTKVPFVWANAPSENEVKSGSKLLKIGMKGEFVKKLQSELNKAAEQDGNPNYNVGKVDGFFGRKTKRGLANFQTSAGLKPDGIMGTQTFKTLFRETPEKIDLQTKTVKDVEPEISKAEVKPQSTIPAIKDVKPETPKGRIRRQSTIPSVKENDMNNKPTIKESLKKNLKQTLNEKRRLEENLIIESKIIKNRFNIISEGLVLETEDQKIDFVQTISEELNYLANQGYSSKVINEGLFSFLGGLFGGSVKSVPAVFGEYIAQWLTKKLGIPEGSYLQSAIVALVGNLNIADYDKLFTDCRFASNKIADSLIEGYLLQMQQRAEATSQGATGFITSAMRNAIADYFLEEKDGIIQILQDKIGDFICPKLSKVASTLQDKAEDIKDKVAA